MSVSARRQCAVKDGGDRTLFDVKPAVGFTLPSAGVTPAPGIKKDAGLRPCSKGLRRAVRISWRNDAALFRGRHWDRCKSNWKGIADETFRFDLRTNCDI